MVRTFFVIFSFRLALLVECKQNLISFDLEPVSYLFHEKAAKLENGSRILKTSEENGSFHPGALLHPYNGGVYTSFVEIQEDDGRLYGNGTLSNASMSLVRNHNRKLKDFSKIRHISRFELHHRAHVEKEESDTESYMIQNRTTIRRGYGKRSLEDSHRRGTPPNFDGENDFEAMRTSIYNSFQTAPLSQGYGTHYITVWVGSPTPQRKTLIVDTGSHHTAFPCKGCDNCGEEFHTDAYFDPESSQSFSQVQCNECRWGAQCKPIFPQEFSSNLAKNITAHEIHGCVFSQSYTEGSSWHAYQVRDRIFCGGIDVLSAADPIDQTFGIHFLFGCQTSATGLFVTQLADGIMGLSQHEATLPRALFKHGKINNRMFAICFRKEAVVSKKGISAGVMTIGGIDTRLDSTPMVYARNLSRTGWYTVYVKNVFLRMGGGESAKIDEANMINIVQIPVDISAMNSGKGVIIDSGTTDTYLHTSLEKPFNDAWKTVTGKSYTNSAIRLSREQLNSLPTILVQLMAFDQDDKLNLKSPDEIIGLVGTQLDPQSPHDVLLAIPASHYMEYSPSKDVYTSRFYFSESRGGVIGANSLQGHDVLFDFENGRIGFAESNCKIFDPRGEVTKFEDEEGGGSDCIVKEQTVSTSCLQTVNLLNCTESNLVVKGTETWSFVVERPAEMQGKSCEEIIRKNILKEEGDLLVECNTAGFCTAIRPCEVSCTETVPVAPVPQIEVSSQTEDAPLQRCGENTWGACLGSCFQTKISSIHMSDGLCHEDISKREERECHTEFCGMSDPCHIPFLVHIILAFRGIDPSFWDKQAEGTVVNGFANSVKNSAGARMIDPGDIEVLMTSPWEEIIGDDSGETMHPMMNVLGLKVVLEVHIHNPNVAHFLNNDVNLGAQKGGVGSFGDTFKTVLSRMPKMNEKVEMTECKSSDVYKLALKAHEIQYRLEDGQFMRRLATQFQQEMSNTGYIPRLLDGFVENDELFVRESTVISSWTIKTEVSGGSLYDHMLDPYPGNLDLVQVSVSLVQMTSCLALFFVIFLIRHRKLMKEGNSRLLVQERLQNVAALCPAPFQIVTKKLGVNMTLRRRGKISNNEPGVNGSEELHGSSNNDDQLSEAPKSKYQSKLSDIIRN